MNTIKFIKIATTLIAALAVSGCGNNKVDLGNAPGGKSVQANTVGEKERSSLWGAFSRQDNENKVAVNKYIWAAAIEVLDFLPIQTVDPFTGVIVTDYGTPPNGGRSYRATILINDPALDARSLNVALQTRGGAAPAATTRAVEDAILSRARELRIQDGNF